MNRAQQLLEVSLAIGVGGDGSWRGSPCALLGKSLARMRQTPQRGGSPLRDSLRHGEWDLPWWKCQARFGIQSGTTASLGVLVSCRHVPGERESNNRELILSACDCLPAGFDRYFAYIFSFSNLCVTTTI